MSMPQAFALACRLHAETLSFRRAVSGAERCVAEWLSRCTHPYVAFSAGKDSTCVLALVRAAAPNAPAVYLDAECAFPEVETMLAATPNVIREPSDEPFLVTLQRHGLKNDRAERATMQSTVWGPVKRLVAKHGFDGCAYGLRAEESAGRRRLRRIRGTCFWSATYGVWQAQPIADWTYDDVWAFIVSRGLAYCHTYDRMWDMPAREQRISYWAGESNRTNGRYVWLRRNYPQLFSRLALSLPEVRDFV